VFNFDELKQCKNICCRNCHIIFLQHLTPKDLHVVPVCRVWVCVCVCDRWGQCENPLSNFLLMEVHWVKLHTFGH